MTDTRPLDLTPREVRPARSRGGGWLPWLVLATIAVAIAVLLWVLMTNSQAFLEADIAVAEREEQGDRRFQLLGTPIADADSSDTLIVDGEEVTPFSVVFDGVLVDVINQGTPPDLFQPGVPVVLEGQWVQGAAPIDRFAGGANDGWYFAADRMLVKHDNEYREDRLDDAEYRGRSSRRTHRIRRAQRLTCQRLKRTSPRRTHERGRGVAGVILSLVASVIAIPMLVVGHPRPPARVLRLAHRYAWMVLAGWSSPRWPCSGR